MSTSQWSDTITFSTKTTFPTINEEALLISGESVGGDAFTGAMAISADGVRVIVGAYGVNSGTGKAYIFVRSGTSWSLEAGLTASDAATASYFGYSVSICDNHDRVIVGAYYATNNSITAVGQAYVFSRSGTTWTEEAILVPSNAAYGCLFGYSVSMDSNADRVAIGAYRVDYNSVGDSGAAYIFSRSGTAWTEEAILSASDAATSDYLGWSISISGDGTRCIVGSRDADYNSIVDSGKAYIYSRSGTTWTEEAILHASDAATTDRFSWSVSMDTTGTRVAVSCYLLSNPSNDNKVYVFSRSGTTWTEETIIDPGLIAAYGFGNTISMNGNGDKILVGAYNSALNHGVVYLYTRASTTWTLDTITSTTNVPVVNFASIVAMARTNSRVVCGSDSNKAFIFA